MASQIRQLAINQALISPDSSLDGEELQKALSPEVFESLLQKAILQDWVDFKQLSLIGVDARAGGCQPCRRKSPFSETILDQALSRGLLDNELAEGLREVEQEFSCQSCDLRWTCSGTGFPEKSPCPCPRAEGWTVSPGELPPGRFIPETEDEEASNESILKSLIRPAMRRSTQAFPSDDGRTLMGPPGLESASGPNEDASGTDDASTIAEGIADQIFDSAITIAGDETISDSDSPPSLRERPSGPVGEVTIVEAALPATRLDRSSRSSGLNDSAASGPAVRSGSELQPSVLASGQISQIRSPDALVGQQVGEWVFEKLLGRGAMGAVYKARSESGRLAAVKIVLPGVANAESYTARFEQEARVTASLSHPGIVGCYGFGMDPIPHLALEFVDGTNLRAKLKEQRRFELPEALRFGRLILEALVHAHAKGVVHRDLKPENVMVAGDGSIRVADFGLAREEGKDDSPRLTLSGQVMGTPAYMAPEQINDTKRAGPPADMYAVGVMLFNFLAGQPVFTGSQAKIMLSHLRKDPPDVRAWNPQVSKPLADLIQALLAKEPESRPSAAASLVQIVAFEAELSGVDTAVTGPGVDLVLGTQLGAWTLDAELGVGGMGRVYRAHRGDESAALKVMVASVAEDPSARARFEREAQVMRSLAHPNVIRVLDVGVAVSNGKSWPYIAMEQASGDLASRIQSLASLDPREAVEITLGAARALSYAHSQQVVHRDVKPENLLLIGAEPYSAGAVRLTDFGVAAARDSHLDLTRTTAAIGSPFYMAPEQADSKAKVDGRADLYALGATLYHCLTGARLFAADNYRALLLAHAQELPVSANERNGSVPDDLALILDWALLKRPSDRPESVELWADTLQSWLDGRLTGAEKSRIKAAVRKGRKPFESKRPLWHYGVLAAIAMVLVAVLAFRQGTQTSGDRDKAMNELRLEEQRASELVDSQGLTEQVQKLRGFERLYASDSGFQEPLSNWKKALKDSLGRVLNQRFESLGNEPLDRTDDADARKAWQGEALRFINLATDLELEDGARLLTRLHERREQRALQIIEGPLAGDPNGPQRAIVDQLLDGLNSPLGAALNTASASWTRLERGRAVLDRLLSEKLIEAAETVLSTEEAGFKALVESFPTQLPSSRGRFEAACLEFAIQRREQIQVEAERLSRVLAALQRLYRSVTTESYASSRAILEAVTQARELTEAERAELRKALEPKLQDQVIKDIIALRKSSVLRRNGGWAQRFQELLDEPVLEARLGSLASLLEAEVQALRARMKARLDSSEAMSRAELERSRSELSGLSARYDSLAFEARRAAVALSGERSLQAAFAACDPLIEALAQALIAQERKLAEGEQERIQAEFEAASASQEARACLSAQRSIGAEGWQALDLAEFLKKRSALEALINGLSAPPEGSSRPAWRDNSSGRALLAQLDELSKSYAGALIQLARRRASELSSQSRLQGQDWINAVRAIEGLAASGVRFLPRYEPRPGEASAAELESLAAGLSRAYQQILARHDELAQARLPGGVFKLGFDEGRAETFSHEPAHEVSLAPFALDRREVSEEDFCEFIDFLELVEPARIEAVLPARWTRASRPRTKLPVRELSVAAAEAYAQWCGKRLPSEAEWEFAARRSGQRFPWGAAAPITGFASFSGRALSQTWENRLGASPDGVLNLIGNVAEWTSSSFTPYPKAGAGSQGLFEPFAGQRVIRGGHFETPRSLLSSWRRDHQPAGRGAETIGFRCALSLAP